MQFNSCGTLHHHMRPAAIDAVEGTLQSLVGAAETARKLQSNAKTCALIRNIQLPQPGNRERCDTLLEFTITASLSNKLKLYLRRNPLPSCLSANGRSRAASPSRRGGWRGFSGAVWLEAGPAVEDYGWKDFFGVQSIFCWTWI